MRWMLICLLLAGCARTPSHPSTAQVQAILAKGAPYSESSFYACLLNGSAQRLPWAQIQKDCETKLADDDKKGFGRATENDLLGPLGHGDQWFDPTKVTAVCNSGNAGRAAGKPAYDGFGAIQKNYRDGRQIDWGRYSWGGKGKCDDQGCYKGLSEEESFAQKTKAMKEYEDAYDEWREADDDARANPNDAAKKERAQRLKKVMGEKGEQATKDPNKKEESKAEPAKPRPNSRPVGPGESPCEQALDGAREVLAECQRTGWKPGDCQRLLAKLKGCPDPGLIYVDPDGGYACRAPIDPEALKEAWVAKCQELERPNPGGPDPCEPPRFDQLVRYVSLGKSAPERMCKDPAAHVDPDSPECLGTLTIQRFTPDLQTLLIWGLNKLGGPIVVLPSPKPEPSPQPEPGPGPKPDPFPT